MQKYSVRHPDTWSLVEAYLYTDIRKEYSSELRKDGIWSVHKGSMPIFVKMFADRSGVPVFKAGLGQGKHKWFVIACRFDSFIEKSGWKSNAEIENMDDPEVTRECDKQDPEPKPAERAAEHAERSPDLSVAFIEALERLFATMAENKFKEQIEEIGERIASQLVKELPALMFHQMQGGISRLIEIKIHDALEGATDPNRGAA